MAPAAAACPAIPLAPIRLQPALLLRHRFRRVVLPLPERRTHLQCHRVLFIDVGEVGSGVCCLGPAPGDHLGAPALVDVAKAVKLGTCSSDRGKQLLTTGALLRVGDVEDSPWWTVCHDDVDVCVDGEVVALVVLELEPHLGVPGWGVWAGVDCQAGTVGESEDVPALAEKDDAGLFGVFKKLLGFAVVAELLAEALARVGEPLLQFSF